MKNKIQLSSAAILAFVTFLSFKVGEEAAVKELSLGSAIPKADIKMEDVSGKQVSLSDAKQKNGLLVIFSCNTCPFVIANEARIKEVAALAKSNGIGVLVINSNEAQRSKEDSFEAMKKYAQEQKYDFSYVVDKNSELADAFGATRTPETFLFDKKGSLVYKGAIDDSPRDKDAIKTHFLKDALTAAAKGEQIKTGTTKSVGCTIKRLPAAEHEIKK